MPDCRFRPVIRDDLPMLAAWSCNQQVSAWWQGLEHQLALMTLDLDHPAMAQVIVLSDSQPIAYAQYHHAQEWTAPHFADLPQDLLANASVLVINPDPANLRAIRARGKAGFSGGTIQHDGEGHPCRLMTRRR